MWLIIPFKQGGQIHEKVVSKGKNPITSLPLSKNAVATILRISKLFPLILLKSIGYLLWSCFLFCLFPLLSCYISISFSTIKGIQISLFSLLFLGCFIKSLFCYCGLILHISHSICSLYRWPQTLTIFRRHLHYFVPLNCLGRHFFLMMHLALPFHFIILIHCIFLYYSLLYFDSKLALLMDETDARQCWTC